MNQKTLLKKEWSMVEVNEILCDCIGFEFILEMKRRIKNIETKSYISMFLKTMAPVLVYELANSLEIIGIKSKSKFFSPGMEKRVRDERQKFCHKIIIKSSLPLAIQKEMGLNFNEDVYDMNVIVKTDSNELLDMNYEIYTENIANNLDFWNSLFGIPRLVADTIFSCLGFDFSIEKLFSIMDEKIIEILETIQTDIECQRYSYSVHKLFSKSPQLSIEDKIFILYRYRLITSIKYLEKMLPNLTMKQDGACIIDIKAFFRKYKAIVICIIGQDLKDLNSELGFIIKSDIEKKISDKSFFSFNRKLRNNIHYSQIEKISEYKIKVIDQYQNVYINIIKERIEEKLYIDIDEECLTMTNFLEEILRKGISRE